MIKTVVFDAFDTLFRVENGASASYIIDRITKSGHTVDKTEFFTYWKAYYKENTADTADFKTEREIFTSRIQMFYNKYDISRNAANDADFLMYNAAKRAAFDDVIPTLSYLKEKFNIYIGSNTDNDVLSSVIQHNDINVDRIYTSESLKCYKPSEQFYIAIAKDNGLRHDEVLFVGDNLVDDVLGPQQVNMKTCWLNRNRKPRTAITPDYEIQSLAELIHIFEEA